MAASSAVQNPPVQAESKSSRKKKAKAAERAESPAPSASPVPEKSADGQDESSESPYIRELLKNLRNVNKRITNASKTDSLIAEHKDKSLEDLVNLKIINADQKAQHLKKPALLSQASQLEEQLTQYRKVDAEYKAKLAADKAELEKTLTEKFEREKEEAVAEAKEAAKTAQNTDLLLISQFLQLAAARRAEDADQAVDENQALEGVLLAIYSGDDGAVDTMIKLVEGSDEKTHNTAFEPLPTTYAQIKTAAQAHKTALAADAPSADVETSTETPASDPTIAHASLTEIEAGDTALTNGQKTSSAAAKSSGTGDVANAAANEAAETQWDNGNEMSMSISQEWVDVSVPRDPAETETGISATPAAATNTQSWADDQPEPAPEAPADPNDGFSQVPSRNRGPREHNNWRPRGRGEYRGRGRGGGEGRGRGRGGRGRGSGPAGGDGNVPVRGPRKTEE